MRLPRALLDLLNTELRRWAGLRVAALVAGRRLVYVGLENGFCGLAVSEGLEGVVQLAPAEQATPRTLARRAAPGLPAAAALAAAAAAYAVKAFLEGFRPVSVLMELGVGEARVRGGRWLAELARSHGVRVADDAQLELVGEDVVAAGRWEKEAAPAILVGASPVPGLAWRLGFTGYLGLYVRPELCPLVERLTALGYGLPDLLSRLRGLLVHGGLRGHPSI